MKNTLKTQETLLDEAIQLVNNWMTISKAAKAKWVWVTTLWRRFNNIWHDENKGVKTSDANTLQSIVVLPDLHYPFNIKLDGIFSLIKEIQPHTVILLGDACDCQEISRFTDVTEENGLYATYDQFVNFNKDVLSKIRKLAPDTKIVLTIWNHEDRYYQFIERNPERKKFLDIEELMSEVNEFVPLNTTYTIWDWAFTHWLKCDAHHAKTTLNAYNTNVMVGHSHDAQVFSRQTPVWHNPLQCISLWCLCDLNPSYMKNRPNNWSNQFCVSYNVDGTLYNSVVEIRNNQFIYNGKLYKC